MKINKKKRPPESQLIRKGKIWWLEINEQWVKCIPYNNREEIPDGTQGDDDLTDSQFKTLIGRFDTLENKVDRNTEAIKNIDAKVDAVDAKVDAVDTKVDAVDAKLDKHIIEGH